MEPSVAVKNLSLSFGSVDVLKELNLEIAPGEFLVLLGSSGCGKSTLLNTIAGLLEPTRGQVFINGKNMTWRDPSQRGIGMVFQSYALYPQMTVRGNLSFGLRNSGASREEVAKRIDRVSEILRIEALLDRKPAALSGGQRQRVAIGRALVREVDVFLFDEPLSNLDAKLRTDLRVEIKQLHQTLGNTMIYVTHDQVEALTLADRIAVMRDGKIMQLASPDEIYNTPAHRYVADFIGSPSMNFVEGHIEGNTFKGGGIEVPLNGYSFAGTGPVSGAATLGLRPENILVGEQAQSAPVQKKATVTLVEPMGPDTVLHATLGESQVKARVESRLKVSVGETLDVGFNPEDLALFDAKTEVRL